MHHLATRTTITGHLLLCFESLSTYTWHFDKHLFHSCFCEEAGPIPWSGRHSFISSGFGQNICNSILMLWLVKQAYLVHDVAHGFKWGWFMSWSQDLKKFILVYCTVIKNTDAEKSRLFKPFKKMFVWIYYLKVFVKVK